MQKKINSINGLLRAMVDESNGLQQHLGYDTVHPNAAGYEVMEQVNEKNQSY